jgi:transketolase
MESLYDELSAKALKIRRNIINMIYLASSGHPGGALSLTDILTVLYFTEMKVNPLTPKDENRDRFVLSKGHASAALYATLAERGFIRNEELFGFRKIDSILQGHPDMKKIPGVDMTTGSLGQGLSVANGMAMAGKLDKKDYRVYCALGDGEIEEGQVWEAAMSASHYKLDNLCVIVDNNNLQIDGTVDEVMNPYSIVEKFKSFGFNTIEIDGHDFKQIIEAFENAKNTKDKPTAIVAKTIKGKGVSYMENQASWHGKAPNEQEFAQAMQELI